MCRLLGWVANAPVTLADVLGDDSLAAFADLSHLHGDGWGFAAAHADDLAVRRSTHRAATDPEFHRLAAELAAPVGLAHLRWATPGLPVTEANTHPFRYRHWAFAHNGAVHPHDRLASLLTPDWQGVREGTTDSEHYFLAVMAEIEQSGVDLPTAVERVVQRIAETMSASSLNALCVTPDALYVINCHDAAQRPVIPLPRHMSVNELVASVELDAPYFDLRYLRTDHAVVAASSGFAQPPGGGWEQLPNNAVLVIDRRSLEVDLVPLAVQLGQSATSTSTT